MRRFHLPAAAAACALLGLLPAGGDAQSRETRPRPADAHPSVRAVRVDGAPHIDGVLDEAFWASIEPVTAFRQREPVDGGEPTEATEVRVAYDDRALYFGLLMHDSDPSAIRRSILQREGRIDKDDRVILALDTYGDGRNAYIFELNSFGTQGDALITDEDMTLDDWNWEGVYESEARLTDVGWALEVAIPFTTIRFRNVDAPEMGFAVYRSIRRKNEEVTWPHIPQQYKSGIFQVSQYAKLEGLQNLKAGRHLEVKPFAIAGAQKTAGVEDTDVLDDVGLDVKYALGSNLTMDLTWNTDFAQVEADNVQINLSRFDLFYPEKREFFLERAGLFQFGAQQETEVFFSRRIGLENPIVGGGRVTGQSGPFSVGALSLRTEAMPGPDGVSGPGAWSSVARVRADVLPRTTIGGIVTSVERDGASNRVAGADALARFWGSSSLFVWGANVWDSERPGSSGSTAAAQAELTLRNPKLLFEVTRTLIGSAFDPALGFVPRPDQKRWGGQLGFTPRFEGSTWARQLSIFLQGNHITGMDDVKQSHFRRVQSRLSFQTGEAVTVEASERFEGLQAPSAIQGRPLDAGDYTFRFLSGSARTNDSRTLSGNVNWSAGDFWSGTRTSYGVGMVWKTGPRLTIDAGIDRNHVMLPVEGGDFTTHVVGADIQAAVSRKLFANALLQWDDVSNTLQANIRVDWIHTPGSDLFVVLDTGYLTGVLADPRDTRWQRRTGVVKLTWLKAF